MKKLAAKAGFELANVGTACMDAYMKARTRVYTEVGKRMGLGGGSSLTGPGQRWRREERPGRS